jgi:cardiolipin synthase (CMP-forming)
MSPNLITAVRIALLVPLFWLLTHGGATERWIALAVFLLAGLTDIFDGWLARRTGRTSALGAMLDLVADRLLTLVTLVGLIASQSLDGLYVVAGLILIARDVVVAALNEALPGKLAITVSPMERAKVALQFFGMALLIAPLFWTLGGFVSQYELGAWCLALSALLASITLADYAARARAAFRKG